MHESLTQGGGGGRGGERGGGGHKSKDHDEAALHQVSLSFQEAASSWQRGRGRFSAITRLGPVSVVQCDCHLAACEFCAHVLLYLPVPALSWSPNHGLLAILSALFASGIPHRLPTTSPPSLPQAGAIRDCMPKGGGGGAAAAAVDDLLHFTYPLFKHPHNPYLFYSQIMS